MLSDQEFMRYSRQLLLEEIGPQGQEKLSTSSVLIVGLGGLGTPAAMYLAAAGIGKIILADGDRLHISNLQRQILYRTDDLGRSKVETAKHH
ncbi:MAG: ThiF family adenylyltransferase, partial [Hafnia sp.]